MAEGFEFSAAERVHLVGVGGAGMSALARLLAARGYRVSGSDARPSPVLSDLASAGVRTWAGHDPDAVGEADLVVASSAVPYEDPELEAARRRGVEVWDRPRLLAALTALIPTIGATGTHGKTSTTAMLVVAARAAGLDPSFVVGGILLDLGLNGAAGEGDLLVLEVDEAFGTFEHLHLRGLVVTNVEADHLDHFGTLQGVHDAFTRVARGVDGPVLACVDDAGSRRLLGDAGAVGYGTGDEAVWRIESLSQDAAGSRFVLGGPGHRVEVALPRPGIHMARNAAGALALLGERGVDLEAAAGGLASFRGVGRRWDVRGTVGGITVVDDYAHHPTEVEATLDAARRSGRRVVAVFQPHLYSRTREHAEAFGRVLATADVAVVLDVYGDREAPVEGVDGRLISDVARRVGGAAVIDAPDRVRAAEVVSGVVEEGDLVVCMGAGDVTHLASELVARWSGSS